MKEIKNEEGFERYPFGGILGNSVIVRVLEQFIADPDSAYSISDLAKLTNSSKPAVSDSIEQLKRFSILRTINKNKTRPQYVIRKNINKLTALILLQYAVIDDEQGTELMMEAISELSQYYQPNREQTPVYSTNPAGISQNPGGKQLIVFPSSSGDWSSSQPPDILLKVTGPITGARVKTRE